MPNYNYADYLPKCFESILNQKMKPVSVTFIDDSSTDKSIDIVKFYKKKINNLKIIVKKKNQGLYKNLNHEIRLTKEKLIYFMSSDDYISECFFLETYKIFSNFEDLKLCSFQTQYVDKKNNNLELNNGIYLKNNKFLLKKDFLKKFNSLNINYQTNGIVFNQNIFKNLRFPENGSLSDSALVYLIGSQFGGYFSEKKLSYFRIHGKNLSKFSILKKSEHLNDIYSIKEWLKNKLSENFSKSDKSKLSNLWFDKEITNFKVKYCDLMISRIKKNIKLKMYIHSIKFFYIIKFSRIYFLKILKYKLLNFFNKRR